MPQCFAELSSGRSFGRSRLDHVVDVGRRSVPFDDFVSFGISERQCASQHPSEFAVMSSAPVLDHIVFTGGQTVGPPRFYGFDIVLSPSADRCSGQRWETYGVVTVHPTLSIGLQVSRITDHVGTRQEAYSSQTLLWLQASIIVPTF